ncbi:MAG: hypothetical protein CMJ62_03310 [Planctomycetaceae bacterium]|nr:hypothetical protein [Planctomycetaceae bacterium]
MVDVVQTPAREVVPDNTSTVCRTWTEWLLSDASAQCMQLNYAVAYLFLLPLDHMLRDLAWILLAACAIVRLRVTWRGYRCLACDPLIVVLGLWSLWHGISILWSPHWSWGVDEWTSYRTLLLPFLLWPIRRQADLLVAGLLAGIFLANAVQLIQYLHWFGMTPNFEGRLHGLLHPTQTGVFCLAAISWHTVGLIQFRSIRRSHLLLSCLGLCAAIAGLISTGSRGPWIGGICSLSLGLLLITWCRPCSRKSVLTVTAIILLSLAATWPWCGPLVSLRLENVRKDLQRMAARDFTTDNGRRLAFWETACKVFVRQPLLGTGAGGFSQEIDLDKVGYDRREHSHAHSTYLHELASKGAPGAFLLLASLGLCMKYCLTNSSRWFYGMGTPMVLGGWAVSGTFDTFQLSATTFGLFSFIATLALSMQLPGERQQSLMT